MSRHYLRARTGEDRASLYDDITNKIIAELEAGVLVGNGSRSSDALMTRTNWANEAKEIAAGTARPAEGACKALMVSVAQ